MARKGGFWIESRMDAGDLQSEKGEEALDFWA
jgi:hypothetical protein